MYRTVPVECWGESYCSLMLVENINCCVCDCTEEILYVPLMLLKAYRAAGLLVNMLKDNTEMDITEMAALSMRNELNLINI